MNYIIAILLFSIIILFHELGHFLLAKRAGVKVEEFALGIGPTLIGKKIGETTYGIKALPLGGCCVMEGEDKESDSNRAFCNKSILDRALIVAAGPVFNFIMALVFSIILIMSFGIRKPIVAEVAPGSAAEQAGIQVNDEITKINGRRIHFFKEITVYSFANPGKTAQLEIKRGEKVITKEVTPQKDDAGAYKFGIASPKTSSKVSPIAAIGYGVWDVKYWIQNTFVSIKMLTSGTASASDISGPVGIVKIIGDGIDDNVKNAIGSLLNFGVLLSANLGVMNLLPIPALDGGRLVFLLIEKIRRKPMNAKVEGMINMGFLTALSVLMLFVFVGDIMKIIT